MTVNLPPGQIYPGGVYIQQSYTIADILGAEANKYMVYIFMSSIILLIYVIWRNFLMNSRFQRFMIKYDIDIDELAILPSVMLFIVSGSYYFGW